MHLRQLQYMMCTQRGLTELDEGKRPITEEKGGRRYRHLLRRQMSIHHPSGWGPLYTISTVPEALAINDQKILLFLHPNMLTT